MPPAEQGHQEVTEHCPQGYLWFQCPIEVTEHCPQGYLWFQCQ